MKSILGNTHEANREPVASAAAAARAEAAVVEVHGVHEVATAARSRLVDAVGTDKVD